MTEDLFQWADRVHHHSNDVHTSVEAARSAKTFANGHARIAYNRLKNGPATASEIAADVEMELYQIRRRLTDLHRAGWIERTGITRPTPSNRQECEWRVTSKIVPYQDPS